MAFSCWMGRASSFRALGKACCRSLLLIGCRFKCFWGSPTAPLGQGPCLDNVTVGPLFKNFTLYRHHTLCFIFTNFFTFSVMLSMVHILLACTLCNIKRKVFFYNFALNSIVLLEAWNEGLVLVMHFMFTWLHCILFHCISIVYRLQVALVQCFDVELRVISTGYCKEYFYSIGWILLAKLWGCLAFSPAPAFSSQAALSPQVPPPPSSPLPKIININVLIHT